jgi:hypothetical protein
MDCEYMADLTPWHTSIQRYFISAASKKKVTEAEVVPEAETLVEGEEVASPDAAPVDGSETAPTDAAPPETVAETPVEPPLDATAEATAGEIDPATGLPVAGGDGGGLTAGGWVIEMVGHHFHNSMPDQNVQVGDEATQFVINTFCKNLETGTVMLPDGEDGKLVPVKIADLGIKYPTVVWRKKVQRVDYRAESEEEFAQRTAALQAQQAPGGVAGPAAVNQAALEPKTFPLRRYDFIVQFMWQPQPRTARQQKQLATQPSEATDTAAVGDEAAPTGDST